MNFQPNAWQPVCDYSQRCSFVKFSTSSGLVPAGVSAAHLHGKKFGTCSLFDVARY